MKSVYETAFKRSQKIKQHGAAANATGADVQRAKAAARSAIEKIYIKLIFINIYKINIYKIFIKF